MKKRTLTLVLGSVIVGLVGYLLYEKREMFTTPTILMDPSVPPLKTDFYQPCVPVNVETRGVPLDYSQLGLLTRGDTILPLFGRRLWSDKWQYYAISNTGVVNTKLPMKFNGRSCTGEYGCGELSTGDTVYVEGYKQSFGVTLYETARLQYLPYV